MTSKGPYARVYQSIVDDPMFERVYDNDHALATWLRMLLIADAMWPTSAPMPSRNPTVRLLIDCGLVIPKPGNRYSMRGLDAERERRSALGRIGAAKRWQSDRNAEPLLDEQSKEEKSNGASAFMTSAPGRRDLHDGRHGRTCSVCVVVLGSEPKVTS